MSSCQPLGHTLRDARTTAHLTLQTVAAHAGISHQHLSRIERNERPISRRILGDLDLLYGLPDAVLLAWVRQGPCAEEDAHDQM